MKNILGQDLEATWRIVDHALEEHRRNPEAAPVSDIAKIEHAYSGQAGEGVFVHIYGKTESRPKRKMAHITFVPMSEQEYNHFWANHFVYGKTSK